MQNFLTGGGRMGQAIRDHDWDANPLGPPAGWPAVLKITASTMLSSRFPQALVWGPERIFLYNDAYGAIMAGKPNGIGRRFQDVWSEVWDDISDITDRAFAGEATFIEDFELTIERGSGPEKAWFTFCYSPVRDEFGHVAGMLNTVIETTGKVQAERTARLVTEELAHRIKNTFAVFQAIASQSFRGDAATPEARSRFEARIAAMASAQDVLLHSERRTARISEVIERTLRPYGDGTARITVEGPDLTIAGRQALSLALAVHELATNATKYGALSVPAGSVSLTWEGSETGIEDPFVLRWEERGGPAPHPSAKAGFGSRLIQQVFPADFGGTASYEMHTEGLRFVLETRSAHLRA